MKPSTKSTPKPTPETCARCEKVLPLCFCAEIAPHATEHRVLILQHPQEPDKTLGTARIAQLSLANAELKVGLSWRSHRALLGEDANPSEWGILYLGSGVKVDAGRPEHVGRKKPLTFVGKNGAPTDAPTKLKGFIVLDGTWSQAKALWWRNAWMLKHKRMILTPAEPSLYGKLRKEPRRECLSTIETIAVALEALGEDPKVSQTLRGHFRKLLQRARDAKAKSKPAPAKVKPATAAAKL